jgi:hypothetical protein
MRFGEPRSFMEASGGWRNRFTNFEDENEDEDDGDSKFTLLEAYL